MTTPKPAARREDSRVPADAPIRQYRKVTLSRDEYEAIRSGLSLDDVRRYRAGIVASDARQEGE